MLSVLKKLSLLWFYTVFVVIPVYHLLGAFSNLLCH